MGFFDFMKKKEVTTDLPPLPDLASPASNPFPTGIDQPQFSESASPPFQSPSWDQHPTASAYPAPSSSSPGYGSGASFNPPPFGSSPAAPAFSPPAQGPDAKDVQIIIAKLDAIRAEVESMSQRVQKIERIAEGTLERPPERKYNW